MDTKYVKSPLEVERDMLIIKLNNQIETNTKANEQINLLRFKVEVLLEMLAMEEKKYGATAKRLDALRWAYELQTAQLNQQGDTPETTGSEMADIDSAMNTMSNDFAKDEAGIVLKFADPKGQIASSMGREEFVNTLLTVASTQLSLSAIEV